MLRILIAYDTTEGQTRKIAQNVVDAIARSGKEVQVIDIRRPLTGFTLDGFDAILIGASIHMSKHSRQLGVCYRWDQRTIGVAGVRMQVGKPDFEWILDGDGCRAVHWLVVGDDEQILATIGYPG